MHEPGKNWNLVTAMSCRKLVCFPVVLSNKTNLFIVYGNMWKNLASDVPVWFLANCEIIFVDWCKIT